MRLLLDTHAYLWWLADDDRLSYEARRLIADPRTSTYVSAATVWEIAIKAKLGRLDLEGADVTTEIAANDFIELPIRARHGAAAGALPRHHDDPFDRMLVAQPQAEELILVTHDAKLRAYDVMIVET